MDTTTLYLDRPGGRIGYDRTGSGPLIVLIPGMGDLRQTYRHVVGPLADAGYTVVSADLRGHGDSDPTFADYGDEPTAEDTIALIEHLDAGPALLVGNSMGAGASVIAAAMRPELVSGLALLGPFVRGEPTSAQRLSMRVLMAPAWAASVWKRYLPRLYAGARPGDFADYAAQVAAALRRPGYARAFSLTTRTGHGLAEASIPSVTAPALVLMGSLDPDFPDPRLEAEWIAEHLGGETVMIADAGHYPQSQQPRATLDVLLPFAARVTADA